MHIEKEEEVVTFSFGRNWRSFVDSISEDSVSRAMKNIEDWLGRDSVSGKSVLDIGCGSGLHSLCFHRLGAKEVVSLDLDPYSVDATRLLWEKAGQPSNWKILQGSVLDAGFVRGLGAYDILYSWGVLHHTGKMWEAIANACALVRRGGRLWIAIYVKGPKYPEHLALKQAYNRASAVGKKIMIWKYIWGVMRERRRAGLNPLKWNERHDRGMDVYHDIVDWLGGLPYEVATKEEVVGFCAERGFVLEKVKEAPEGVNNVYLFSLPA